MSVTAQHEGLCLRYPETLGLQPNILAYEMAVSMLLRATQLAQHTPFTWGYIDKPPEGQLFLIFLTPQLPFPPDGIRYQEQEQKGIIPAGGGRELEVMEVKFGFVPGADSMAWRVRRRYRLQKGGHPQLVLIHYTRGQSMPIMPALNQPIRAYPLREINEPAVFVMGDKLGQKVYPRGAAADRQPPPALGVPFTPGMPANPQALLAQQNSNMEALERRNQRDRNGNVGARQQQPHQSRIEEDDSADEGDMISTRTLALTRYRRNHDLMNEVFMFAAFGRKKEFETPPPPFSIFDSKTLEGKVAKLSAEVEELKSRAAARREQRVNAESEETVDILMESIQSTGEGIVT
ncbi:uncharacterized protein FIBRA_03037 [Fibroporia radiculosa]|uniref:SWI/SNF and RSC complexes subunit Ssr4 N-terminal domain-containing protein n=1 Tax=Fibroporia radiculosa TaxID=599839 RepID=J4H266_9APHY|nr:uncharacterized protein FIBRA_03037 [Fibroporia radiculosa]CCM00989.1 predicted protein [Fibroporia radiculosa]